MGSLGETLRQARLDRGASLADAAQETRIPRRYLEALEAEDFAALPAQVYTRGFIRNYALYLGLDPGATLDLFAPSRTREERPVLRSATPQLSSGRPASLQFFLVGAGVLLAALLLIYLWSQYTSFVESIGSADSGSARAVVTTPTRPVVSQSPAPQVPTPTLVAPVASPRLSPTPDSGVVVEARVTDRTWMEVWIDGSSQFQATMQAGTSRTFTATRSVRMRVGNAGGVSVVVNGESQGPLGDRNQVKDFVWER